MTPEASAELQQTDAAAAPATEPVDPNAPKPDEPNPADGETLFGPSTIEAEPIADAGARYHDKPVEILRAATEHDAGFIPGRSDAQLLIKHPDGTLQVVFGDRVTNPTA